jgi:hypothetical protein
MVVMIISFYLGGGGAVGVHEPGKRHLHVPVIRHGGGDQRVGVIVISPGPTDEFSLPEGGMAGGVKISKMKIS